MSRNPSPYSWAVELKDHSTPRTVVLQDIFKMCVDKVFDYTPANMRTLDTRLTRKTIMAKLDAADIFDSVAAWRQPSPPQKKPGRNPKKVYRGRVAKHKARKYAGPDVDENIKTYVEREFEIAGKEALRLATPRVFQTECYKLIQKRLGAIIDSNKLEPTISAIKAGRV
jgi:hypothetical protein